jgi:hypothetical protein
MENNSMSAEEWQAQRERHNKFLETELGKLYAAYSKATIDYWRQDANDACPSAKLRSLDEVYREKQKVFVLKLMEIAGV